MQNLLLNLARRIVQAVARVIGFVAIMLVISIFAVFRGIWAQSDFVAIAWRRQLAFGTWDGHFDGPMYWTIRIIALLTMMVCLIALSEGLSWLVEWALRL